MADGASLVPPSFRPCNLAALPTRLIGREAEVACVVDRLTREGVRLLTLTGAGGVGKTRLAHAVGLKLQRRYMERVWQVELASLRDPNAVVGAVAGALGLEDAGGRAPEETLVNHLRRTSALLLLDTFEHLPAAAALVDRLLASCPKLRILVTSRAPLHLQGEHEVLVRPFAVPDPERLPSLPDLKQCPAVKLFIERARAVQPSFALTKINAATVAAICRRVDGLPLALELAASRVKMFSPKALLIQLEWRLKLLTGGARNVPVRQQTLRDTVAWSYDLLSPPQQTLFCRLAVFADGFTMAAMESVCRVGGETPELFLDNITTLLDNSLLLQLTSLEGEEEDESRFGMLETTREFGIERLTAVGELGQSRERHAAYFLTMPDGT
jgi:predicted ATPase